MKPSESCNVYQSNTVVTSLDAMNYSDDVLEMPRKSFAWWCSHFTLRERPGQHAKLLPVTAFLEADEAHLV